MDKIRKSLPIFLNFMILILFKTIYKFAFLSDYLILEESSLIHIEI